MKYPNTGIPLLAVNWSDFHWMAHIPAQLCFAWQLWGALLVGFCMSKAFFLDLDQTQSPFSFSTTTLRASVREWWWWWWREGGSHLTVQDNNTRLHFHGYSVDGSLQSEQTPPVLQTLHLNGFPRRLVSLVGQLAAHGSLLDSRWKIKRRAQ